MRRVAYRLRLTYKLRTDEGALNLQDLKMTDQKKIKDWKMQDLENNGPNRRAGKCRTWKMTDQIAGR